MESEARHRARVVVFAAAFDGWWREAGNLSFAFWGDCGCGVEYGGAEWWRVRRRVLIHCCDEYIGLIPTWRRCRSPVLETCAARAYWLKKVGGFGY